MYPSFRGKPTKSIQYCHEWQTLAAEIKASNFYVCQECGKQCRRPGELYLGPKYELTVSHYEGEYDAPEVFLAAMCAVCHLRHDAGHSWKARRRHQRRRSLLAGQLALFT